MCGIGIIYGKKIPNKKSWIKRSLEVINHRGYSLYEIKILNGCVLGVNRLQIVDRDNGRQPLENEDKNVFAVLNGEIFNHKELRKELIQKGHKFKTENDTEVLVHLWEEYGPEMVKKIDSEMFTFAIYDKKKDNLFVARDPYGIKPLYYAKDKYGNLHFGSEIKQLTQFEEIEEVLFFPQGHYMLNGKIKEYHKIPQDKTNEKTEDITNKIRTLFDKAVKKRVDTDLPIGVFFSAGIDSTAILATAVKYHKNVTAFVVGHPNSPDVLVAKRYCNENNIKLIHFNPPSEQELAKIIQKIVYITESFEPNMIRQSAISYFIAKIAKDYGLKIVLCGEGPDELFAGYPEFKECKNYREIDQKIDIFIKNLPRTQFQRVDRTSMHFTLEVRVPFFDTEFADYVIRIPSKLKVKEVNGNKITKWILREAMKDRLPDYIANREKVVLSEGAGYKGNQLIGGLFYDLVKNRINDKEFIRLKRKFKKWNITNKEVAYYFKIYRDYQFIKAKFNQKRPLVNAINSIKDQKIEEKINNLLNELLNYSLLDKRETKKFNDVEQIRKTIAKQIRNNQKISLVGYWGIEKEQSDENDVLALENLKILKEKIIEIYDPVEIIIILTDLHGKANKLDENLIVEYFGLIENLAREYKLKTKYLSEIWKKNKIDLNDVLKEVKKVNKVQKQVEKAGIKHHRGKDKILGAKIYTLISQYDCKFMEKMFPDNIFFTYNGANWKELLPKLTTITLFPIKKDIRTKPWHISNSSPHPSSCTKRTR